MARILIVDDSIVARKALQKILLALGHTVVAEVADGAQAFSQYKFYRPDIVTMDLTMAGLNGAEATSQIVAAFPEARIIVVSAREGRQIIFDALERGARHFIVKPFSTDKIAAVLSKVLYQEFDRRKHIKLVRKLKGAGDISGEKGNMAEGENVQMARILIVDDSAVARKSLREIVTLLGHTVVAEAASGSQAFIEYTQHKPDIVTMDLTMQGLSGAEATSKIIASFPEARIIVISAIEERRVVMDALERGARHFIIKPINQDKVASVLNNVLNQHFDQQKHLELVRKLKGTDDSAAPLGSAAPKHLPPYEINLENKLIMVRINSTLSLNSSQSLAIELGEYLTDKPRVLIDFDTTAHLAKPVLAEIDKLIQTVENNAGMAKAASRSQQFVDYVTFDGNVPSLAAVLQCIGG